MEKSTVLDMGLLILLIAYADGARDQARAALTGMGRCAVAAVQRHISPAAQRYVSPVPENAALSSGFGLRVSPITGRWEKHTGSDYAVPLGTPIRSLAAGTIRSAKLTRSCGWVLDIRHEGGLSSRLKHLSTILVSKGDRVMAGQVVARSGGANGYSTGPHLHWELRQGRSNRTIDADKFLRAAGIRTNPGRGGYGN